MKASITTESARTDLTNDERWTLIAAGAADCTARLARLAIANGASEDDAIGIAKGIILPFIAGEITPDDANAEAARLGRQAAA